MAIPLARTREYLLARLSARQRQANDDLARWVGECGLIDQALKQGDRAPDFLLPDVEGRLVSSARLLEHGPLVIAFFRGGWCPFCVAALRALQDALTEIEDLGARLVALTPETGAYPRELKREYSLGRMKILSDVDQGVALGFGIVHLIPRPVRAELLKAGVDLPKRHGARDWMLPLPATYIIGRSGRIENAFIEADVTLRQEPAALVEWLRGAKRGVPLLSPLPRQ